MKPNIALYGGAFDPPQLAHEMIAQEVLRKLDLEKLYIVPSGPHPYKSYKTKDEYRKRISEILVNSLDNPRISLCTDFIDGKIANTTLNTDRYFTEKLGFRPYQIFGSDLIESFSKWDPAGEVAMRLPKIIIKRPGYEINYSKIANFIVLDIFEDLSLSELSSTEVRDNIKNGIYHGMNSEVADFIKENALYLG